MAAELQVQVIEPTLATGDKIRVPVNLGLAFGPPKDAMILPLFTSTWDT